MSIADNLLGGLNRYLQRNTDRIRGYIVSMFDIVGDISGIAGNLSAAVAEIFTVLRSGSGQQITADLIGIFSDAFMGVTALAGSFGRDVLDLIATPIINNQERSNQLFKAFWTWCRQLHLQSERPLRAD